MVRQVNNFFARCLLKLQAGDRQRYFSTYWTHSSGGVHRLNLLGFMRLGRDMSEFEGIWTVPLNSDV